MGQRVRSGLICSSVRIRTLVRSLRSPDVLYVFTVCPYTFCIPLDVNRVSFIGRPTDLSSRSITESNASLGFKWHLPHEFNEHFRWLHMGLPGEIDLLDISFQHHYCEVCITNTRHVQCLQKGCWELEETCSVHFICFNSTVFHFTFCFSLYYIYIFFLFLQLTWTVLSIYCTNSYLSFYFKYILCCIAVGGAGDSIFSFPKYLCAFKGLRSDQLGRDACSPRSWHKWFPWLE